MGKKNKKHQYKEPYTKFQAINTDIMSEENTMDNYSKSTDENINITDVNSNVPKESVSESKNNDGNDWAKYWNIAIGTIILAAIIVLVIIMRGNSGNDNSSEDTENSVLETGASSLHGSVVNSQVMKPIEDGEFTYSFENIDWVLTSVENSTEESKTSVSFYFENFTRRNGVYAQFNRPYKLGSYEGTCTIVESLTYDTVKETGVPLSFVTCRSGEMGSDIVLFQQDDNVIAKIRSMSAEAEDSTNKQMVIVGDFSELYTIPLNTIIR